MDPKLDKDMTQVNATTPVLTVTDDVLDHAAATANEKVIDVQDKSILEGDIQWGSGVYPGAYG